VNPPAPIPLPPGTPRLYVWKDGSSQHHVHFSFPCPPQDPPPLIQLIVHLGQLCLPSYLDVRPPEEAALHPCSSVEIATVCEQFLTPCPPPASSIIHRLHRAKYNGHFFPVYDKLFPNVCVIGSSYPQNASFFPQRAKIGALIWCGCESRISFPSFCSE